MKDADTIRVGGLSNYQCKLLSPILTYYGMEARTGAVRLLSEMGKGEMFDCAMLGDRTFLIEPNLVNVLGYGRDQTGSEFYLGSMLKKVHQFNKVSESLVPIHADGDGHCLVHAISRAIVGRQLFWHALRCNLKHHFEKNLEIYSEMFSNFMEKSEWRRIIAECEPDYSPLDSEQVGMTNFHLFGLANVLHRPIILLDAMSEMHKSGDYSGKVDFLFIKSVLDKCY